MKLIWVLLVLGFLMIGCSQNREKVVPGTYNVNSDFMSKQDAECQANYFRRFNPVLGKCE